MFKGEAADGVAEGGHGGVDDIPRPALGAYAVEARRQRGWPRLRDIKDIKDTKKVPATGAFLVLDVLGVLAVLAVLVFGFLSRRLPLLHISGLGFATPEVRADRTSIAAPETTRRPRGLRNEIVSGLGRLYGTSET
ncbi:MAG TPA: hypothetical protein VFC23_02280, partial [Thermoanaerobaculia bacterium]|nr:hypothetical protein [Thermoanaerobaculia bacterium]